MNARQLTAAGIPDRCRKLAQTALRDANAGGGWTKQDSRDRIAAIVADPAAFVGDPIFGALAGAIVQDRQTPPPREPAPFAVWGRDLIDDRSLDQMRDACSLPSAVAGALMPDAHVGYGLPIGGVLALENAVCPYAVGVDIACRMKLSVLDLPADLLTQPSEFDRSLGRFRTALETGTRFGVGASYRAADRQRHAVMDADWSVTRATAEVKDKAWTQLGTSGSGNHFVEFGVLNVETPQTVGPADLAAGQYVALLSHSGSRGAGASVCGTYSTIARNLLPESLRDDPAASRLGWLDMDREVGQEYWAAMSLMGEYAAANHDVIHRNVAARVGGQVIAGVENHHNFAWKETHQIDGTSREVIVHRKGATPAGVGVLGVIPGSMGTPAHVVRGLGAAASLASAAHGAGRVMSRTQAKKAYAFGTERSRLKARGIEILSAGADEVPGVYKDIATVMAAQEDLVESIATFDPRVVKMSA